MSTLPPTHQEIAETINRFIVDEDSYERAALHLATGSEAIVGIDVLVGETEYRWRGATMPKPTGGGLESICRAAAGLASIGWKPGEGALDLTGDCLKAVRSGAYVLVEGGFLHKSPLILCDLNVSEALKVGAAWLRYGYEERSGVIEIDGQRYITHGDRRVVYIHNTGRDKEDGKDIELFSRRNRVNAHTKHDIDDIGDIISRRLSLTHIEAATIGSRFSGTTDIDYVSTVEADDGRRYQIIIPCTIGEAVSIGAPRGVAVPNVLDWYKVQRDGDDWYEVSGYVPMERARFEPGWVAQHVASGVSVIIRDDTPKGDA